MELEASLCTIYNSVVICEKVRKYDQASITQQENDEAFL